MTQRNSQKEEQWLRLLLKESVDADGAERLKRELEQDFRERECFREVASFVNEVDQALQETNTEVDLTMEQKTELYAHLTSVFETRRRALPKEWLPQLSFALAVMLGTATLVASIPWFAGSGFRAQPAGLHPEGTLRQYQLPEVPELPERPQVSRETAPVETAALDPLPAEQHGPELPYPVLPWEPLNLDFEGPSFDLSEIDLRSSIVSVLEADVRPSPLHRATPDFPVDARRNRADGVVVVEFVVDEAGRVHAPQIASSTHTIFDEAALEAIREWKFTPGEKDGRVVKVRMRIPFVFHHASTR